MRGMVADFAVNKLKSEEGYYEIILRKTFGCFPFFILNFAFLEKILYNI